MCFLWFLSFDKFGDTGRILVYGLSTCFVFWMVQTELRYTIEHAMWAVFFVFHCFTSAPKTFDMERRKSSDWWMDEMLLCCGSSLFTREDFQVDCLIEWVHVIGWVLWRYSGRPVVFVMGCCRPVVSGNMMNLPKLAFSSEFEVSEILKSRTQMDVCMYV